MAFEPSDPKTRGSDSADVSQAGAAQPAPKAPLKARPRKKQKFDPKAAAPVVADKLRQASEMFHERVEQIVPHSKDDPEKWYFKLMGFSFVGVMVVGCLAGLLAFMFTLKSPELVSIPEVKGMVLVDALETLQDYGLLGRVQQKTSDNAADKGTVLDQEPRAGNHVRVGREITLYVSKGNVVEGLGAYIGRNIEDVRQEIKTKYMGDNPALQVGQLTWAFDESEEGTIISQNPSAGTPLNPPVAVSFLVSRGPDSAALEMPDFTGKDYTQVMEILGSKGIPFVFTQAAAGTGKPGEIVSQTPKAKESLVGGTALQLTVVSPESSGDMIGGFFQKEIPEYTIPVEISVFTVDATGGQSLMYQFKSLGGSLSFPYAAANGSELLVKAIGKEISRTTLGKPREEGN